uniref:T9SS type A sorting domain-containing protein n=2 Tax=Gelidibacter sp. TaxID=2018083 RepID=UPI004048F0AF
MKLCVFIFIILKSIFGYAQLYVENDAYIFVNDNVLFSTDYVNLNDTDSYLYLRNEAQLIQGNGSIGNSGIGNLSVQQNGTVHEFAYNYWCSPVGNTQTNTFLNRPFIANNQLFEETLAPITSVPATFISGHNGISSPLQISQRWLYTYDPGVAYSEWDHISSTGQADAGYGFTMKGTNGSGNNQLYDFRGKPNNGTINTNVLLGQQTLVGNPYPSALDAQAYIWDTINRNTMTGTLYFWEQDLSVTSHFVADYVGGYAAYTIAEFAPVGTFVPATFDTYNSDGSLNTTGGTSSSGKQTRRFLPIGQGFMIEGLVNGIARTTNTMRLFVKEGTQSEFFRTAYHSSEIKETHYNDDGFEIVPHDFKRFRINIDFNNTYTRQLVQNFHQTATNGFDRGLESKFSETISSDAYWPLDDDSYVAQAFSFDTNLRIPVVVKLATQQPLRFRIFDIQNFDNSQPIYLHDIVANLYIDLRTQDYNINLPHGNYTNRFEITFTNATTLSDNEADGDDFKVFQNNTASQITILNPNNLNVKEVSLFDITGKRILKFNSLVSQSEYHFSTKNLSEGVYVVKISLKNSNTISKKVIVKN